nr:MAG TPA: hypothetical protein [Caudoviricetes sp.]
MLLLIIGIICYEIVSILISDNIAEFAQCNAFALYVTVIFLVVYFMCWRFSHG